MFHFAARVDEVPPGTTRFCCIEGQGTVLAHWEGHIYALAGICPHRNNPLEGARLWGHLLDCPWHHFQYDIRTGENHYPRNVYPPDYAALQEQVRPLDTYAVEVRGGEIWVDLG